MIVVAGTVAFVHGVAPQTPSSIFDRYAQGDFKGAVDAAAADRDFGTSTKAFERQALPWIAADPASVERRRLVVATFMLEFVRMKLESESRSRGWLSYRDLVEWSCVQLRSTQRPLPGERAWMRASVALAERGLDKPWLTGLPVNIEAGSPVHLAHAEHRFPDDSRLRLARTVLDTHEIDRDISFRARAFILTPAARPSETRAREGTAEAVRSWERLIKVPDIRADAELHIAHLYLEAHEYDAAVDHAARAVELSRDARLIYVAQIVRGEALAALNRTPDAGRAYAQALEVIPGGQSATLALSGWLFLSGQRTQAFELTAAAFAARPVDDDPWRLYYYGDFMYWPDLVRELHEAIR